MTSSPYAQHPVKRVAGRRVLDFVNTVEWRDDPARREERLTSFAEALEWAAQTGLVETAQRRELAAAAAADPPGAERALRELVAFRDDVELLVGQRAGAEVAERRLNRRLERMQMGWRIETIESEGPRAVQVAFAHPLDELLRRLLMELLALLSEEGRRPIRRCANPGCGWLFLDQSRTGRRRWCDMAACGNRAKASRHYRRQRANRG
jgi:predicted RNA-binding Zn ribbon-like protein